MGIYKAGKPFAMLQQDAPDSNTKFLLHSNTTDGSTTFTDSSTANITITAESAPAHKTAHSKFGKSSIFFDGTDDYLQVPHGNNFPLGGAARTIDCWVYQHTTPQAAYYFSYGVGASAGTIFGVSSNSGNWYFQGYGSADFATGVAIVQHKWHP